VVFGFPRMRARVAGAVFLVLLGASGATAKETARAMYHHDWRVLGPFPNVVGTHKKP